MIYVLDFGSQYSHLIVRRVRDLGVYAELVSPSIDIDMLKKASGIILSGGPQNLSESSALRVKKRIFALGIPILGICYGLQLMAYELGGKVRAGKNREYGPADVKVRPASVLFRGLRPVQSTWMSHGDEVVALPKGFTAIGTSRNCRYAAIADARRRLYGIQFHPEVTQTKNGLRMLDNFLNLCAADRNWRMRDFLAAAVEKIKLQAAGGRAVCALSGGVDSAVAAALVHRAIGKNLHCIYVDTGLMRLHESEQVEQTFQHHFKMSLRVVRAEKEFLKKLAGVTDPERKRKIIGELFIRIFEREARRLGMRPGRSGRTPAFLVQGTLYTDAISSGVSVGKTAALIKSHHNVGGLPEKMGFQLIEPLRDLYKDEVRKIGTLIGLPDALVHRQPFPGPGLAVRIIGAITREKLEILRGADAIFREELEAAGLKAFVQQYFAVLPDIKSVGVQGDSRSYGHPIILRAVETSDFMTAHWAKLPLDFLEKVSARITNEIRGINRVVYDITSKPPATVEWE